MEGVRFFIIGIENGLFQLQHISKYSTEDQLRQTVELLVWDIVWTLDTVINVDYTH